MEAARYLRTSSLARKFASDFPDEPHVPLQLPPDQAAAFEGHVRPLLDLAEGGSPPVADAALVRAVGKLLALLERDPAQYGLLRGVADYVQCTFAQCVLDTAAAWACDPDRAAFLRGLRAASPTAADSALLLELRRRLVAAGVGDLSTPLARSLRVHSAPLESVTEGGAGGEEGLEAAAVLPFSLLAAAARGEGFRLSGGRGAWPALRRALAAASGRYLEPVLGEVGEGRARIVVTGGALMAALLGAQHPPALDAAHRTGSGGGAAAGSAAAPESGADVGAASRWFDLAVVGAGDLEAAAKGVEDCVREVLTRHKMRHVDAPLADAAGRPHPPLLLLTQRTLVALLPEPVRGGGSSTGAGVRDVGFRLRLQTYRNIEELLLQIPTPADHPDGLSESDHARDRQAATLLSEPPPAPADEWGEGAAFDGDDAFVLPLGARALATGQAPIDPGRLRAAADATAAALGEGEGAEGAAGRAGGAAAVALVRALALQGWQPEVLLPRPVGHQELRHAGGVLGDLLRASDTVAGAAGADPGASASAAAPEAGIWAGRAAWERADVPPERAAAALVSATDGLALGPEALRAALSGAAGGAGGDAASAAGAAARARELRSALQRGHGWLWHEVDEAGGSGALPQDFASTLRQRLRPPRAPAPPEPVVLPPEDPIAGPLWFYGGLSA